jgi:hypothetical protein
VLISFASVPVAATSTLVVDYGEGSRGPNNTFISTRSWSKLVETEGDALQIPRGSAFIQCISADERMSAGIAGGFVDKFGRTPRTPGLAVGDCVMRDLGEDRVALAAVSKLVFSDKPSYDSVRASIVSCREELLRRNIFKVVAPKVGTGLDGLSWVSVRAILKQELCAYGIAVEIRSLPSTHGAPSGATPSRSLHLPVCSPSVSGGVWWQKQCATLLSEAWVSGARRVLVRMAEAPVTLEFMLDTMDQWLPDNVEVCFEYDVDELLEIPLMRQVPLMKHVPYRFPAVRPDDPFSLRSCETDSGCNQCSIHDAVYRQSFGSRDIRELSMASLMPFAETLRGAPGWWLHQKLKLVPWEQDSVIHPDAVNDPPALQSITEYLLKRAAIAPQPSPSRQPVIPGYEYTDGLIRLPFTQPPPPRSRIFSKALGDDRVPMFTALLRAVAGGWAKFRSRATVTLSHLIFVVWQNGAPRVCVSFQSVNYILSDASVAYGRVGELLQPGAVCGVKVDGKSAFHGIAIHPDDAQHLVIEVGGVALQLERLWFGLSHGPRMFVRLVEASLGTHDAMFSWLMVYMDDVGVAARSTPGARLALISLLLQLMRTGIWIAVAKTHYYPAIRLRILGILACFDDDSIRVSPTSAAKATIKSSNLSAAVVADRPRGDPSEWTVTVRTAALASSLLGKLSFMSEALPVLRPLRVRANAMLRVVPRVERDVTADLDTITSVLRSAPEYSHDRFPKPPYLFVVFDASGASDGGAFWVIVSAEGNTRLRFAICVADLSVNFSADALNSSAAFEGATLVAAMDDADEKGEVWNSVIAMGDPAALVAAVCGKKSHAGIRMSTRSVGLADVLKMMIGRLVRKGTRCYRCMTLLWHPRTMVAARGADSISDAASRVSSLSALARATVQCIVGLIDVDLCARSAAKATSQAWCVPGSGDDGRVAMLSSILADTESRAHPWPTLPHLLRLEDPVSVWLLSWGRGFLRWWRWLDTFMESTPAVLWLASTRVDKDAQMFIKSHRPMVRWRFAFRMSHLPVVEPAGAMPGAGFAESKFLTVTAIATQGAWGRWLASPRTCTHPSNSMPFMSEALPSRPPCRCLPRRRAFEWRNEHIHEEPEARAVGHTSLRPMYGPVPPPPPIAVGPSASQSPSFVVNITSGKGDVPGPVKRSRESETPSAKRRRSAATTPSPAPSRSIRGRSGAQRPSATPHGPPEGTWMQGGDPFWTDPSPSIAGLSAATVADRQFQAAPANEGVSWRDVPTPADPSAAHAAAGTPWMDIPTPITPVSLESLASSMGLDIVTHDPSTGRCLVDPSSELARLSQDAAIPVILTGGAMRSSRRVHFGEQVRKTKPARTAWSVLMDSSPEGRLRSASRRRVAETAAETADAAAAHEKGWLSAVDMRNILHTSSERASAAVADLGATKPMQRAVRTAVLLGMGDPGGTSEPVDSDSEADEADELEDEVVVAGLPFTGQPVGKASSDESDSDFEQDDQASEDSHASSIEPVSRLRERLSAATTAYGTASPARGGTRTVDTPVTAIPREAHPRVTVPPGVSGPMDAIMRVAASRKRQREPRPMSELSPAITLTSSTESGRATSQSLPRSSSGRTSRSTSRVRSTALVTTSRVSQGSSASGRSIQSAGGPSPTVSALSGASNATRSRSSRSSVTPVATPRSSRRTSPSAGGSHAAAAASSSRSTSSRSSARGASAGRRAEDASPQSASSSVSQASSRPQCAQHRDSSPRAPHNRQTTGSRARDRVPSRKEVIDDSSSDGDIHRRPGPRPKGEAKAKAPAFPSTVAGQTSWFAVPSPGRDREDASPVIERSPGTAPGERLRPEKRSRSSDVSPSSRKKRREAEGSPSSTRTPLFVDADASPAFTSLTTGPCGICGVTVREYQKGRLCEAEDCDRVVVCVKCCPPDREGLRLVCYYHQIHPEAWPKAARFEWRPILEASSPDTLGRWVGRQLALAEGVSPAKLIEWPIAQDTDELEAMAAAAMAQAWHADRREALGSVVAKMYQLTLLLDKLDSPISHIEKIATVYVEKRLDDPMPGWHPVIGSTVAKDLSKLASSSRDDGVTVSPFCSVRARSLLAIRGAFEKADHCKTYPITLRELLDRKPPATASKVARIHHDALCLQSLLGHRGGMAPRLRRHMFKQAGPGWVMLWTRRTKVRRGDKAIRKPAMRPQISAMAGPIANEIMARAPKEGPMFPGITTASLNEFLRSIIREVPEHFTLRVHGIRAGTDTVLQLMGLPRDIVEAVGWWTRERRASGYYASLIINKIFKATSIMHRISIIAVAPGSARIKSLGGAVIPDWSCIAALAEDAIVVPEETTAGEVVDLQDDSSDDDHRFAPSTGGASVQARRVPRTKAVVARRRGVALRRST